MRREGVEVGETGTDGPLNSFPALPRASPSSPPLFPQILRITVSSEFDPFFLHSLEVSEEDFQNLKVRRE